MAVWIVAIAGFLRAVRVVRSVANDPMMIIGPPKASSNSQGKTM
jgi:hypothetical protein